VNLTAEVDSKFDETLHLNWILKPFRIFESNRCFGNVDDLKLEVVESFVKYTNLISDLKRSRLSEVVVLRTDLEPVLVRHRADNFVERRGDSVSGSHRETTSFGRRF